MTAETGVKWLLRALSITTIPAFVAAVIPQSWLVEMFRWAEPEFSPGLLVTYTIRCLLAVYAFLGVQALIWSNDVRRYRPVILNFGVFFIIVATVGLAAILITVEPSDRTRAFWIIFIDLAEGLAHLSLLTVLAIRIPIEDYSSQAERRR